MIIEYNTDKFATFFYQLTTSAVQYLLNLPMRLSNIVKTIKIKPLECLLPFSDIK